MILKLGLKPGSGDHGSRLWTSKLSTWENLAFCGAYAAAIAIAAVVFVTSRADVHSVRAWLVFIVFVACLTAILALFHKARGQGPDGREPN